MQRMSKKGKPRTHCFIAVIGPVDENLFVWIQLVPDDGKAVRSQMHTDLMLTSRVRTALDQRVMRQTLEHADLRSRGQATFRLGP